MMYNFAEINVTCDTMHNIGIISLYPPKGSLHVENSGVASYTKNLVISINLLHKFHLGIFANKLTQSNTENYNDDGIEVCRCWEKGPFYPIQLLIEILKHKGIFDVIHIQHEYFLYGGALSAAMFPLLQLQLRILGKPTLVTMHNVVPISYFGTKFMKQNGLGGSSFILHYGLLLNTKLICRLSNKIIVHNEYFKKILIEQYHICADKIEIVPHGIEDRADIISQKDAKQMIAANDKIVILFFGFLSGYKGLETLIDAFGLLSGSKYILIIAGGEHPRLKEDKKYLEYIQSLKIKANKISKNIIFTGFVPENEISKYFCASDLVVLPYTVSMADSGPLAFSIAYNRPFIVSEAFKDYTKFDEICFQNRPDSLANKIMDVIGNDNLRNVIMDYVGRLRNERIWKNAGLMTSNVYDQLIIIDNEVG